MQGMTQEVNRCLTLVRVASGRKRGDKERGDVERFGAAGVKTAAHSLDMRPRLLAKTA